MQLRMEFGAYPCGGGRIAPMTCAEALAQLKALGSEKVREQNRRHGVGDNQFGVKMGDIRGIAKEIKSDHTLGLELWATGNFEARQLAALIMKPKQLSQDELEQMVISLDSPHGADYFISYVVKAHPSKELCREKWLQMDHPMLARAAWSLTTERVCKDATGLDLGALLDRIEREMNAVPEVTRWTMNFCLGEIGINHAAFRERAIQIGEKCGAYRDYPTSKGCVSPFVPIWVPEMVSRQSS